MCLSSFFFSGWGKKYIFQNTDYIAGTDKFSVSHTARTLQKSACSKCSIPVFSHCTMEVVLGSRALIIGNKTALSNQRKQTDLSMNFFLGLKSLERAINKITTKILVQSLAAMQTASIPLMDICICLQEEMEGERFRNCLLVPSAQAWPHSGPEHCQGCSALLCAWQGTRHKAKDTLQTWGTHQCSLAWRPDLCSSPS